IAIVRFEKKMIFILPVEVYNIFMNGWWLIMNNIDKQYLLELDSLKKALIFEYVTGKKEAPL
ncbi:MAG: hypothetical protein II486_03065, partial [Thermoguttaceae bacterium]|nr:hypothetical protein [Thermoguttaceae bacterium]